MSSILIVAGPLALPLVAFSIWSGILSFGEIDGLEHKAGVEPGGTFVLTVEPETGVAEVEGLELEMEIDPIEYREGDEITTVRKLNGLKKYANVTLRWPTGIDTKNWRFLFEDKCPECGEGTEKNEPPELEFGQEMYQIDPPTLVLPAGTSR